MAALNFPNNPADQVPVNTFSPTSTPQTSTNGVTYIYNSTNGTWTAETVTSGTDAPPTIISDTPPTTREDESPIESGDLWWNSSTTSGELYVYYVDVDSAQWVEASPSTSDGYLKLDASNGPVTGPLTFNQLTTHAAGISSNNQIKATSNNTQLALNNGKDNTTRNAVNLTFQHEDVATGQIRTTRPIGTTDDDLSGVSTEIRVGGNGNGNRVVTFGGDLNTNFAGQVTFEGLTTHEAGVSVTGGAFSCNENTTSSSIQSAASGTDARALNVALTGISGTEIINGSAIRVGRGSDNGCNRISYAGVLAVDFKTNTAGQTRYGFKSELTTAADGENYNFYAAGEAQNYVKGHFTVSSNPAFLNETSSTTMSGIGLYSNGQAFYSMTPGDATTTVISISRNGSNGQAIKFRKNGIEVGDISVTNNNIKISGLNSTSIMRNGHDLSTTDGIVASLANAAAALTAIKAAVADSSTDDAGKFAAIATALASF